MHLMMELKNENCCCVLNALVHEFWRDIDVSHLQDSAHVPSTEFNCLLSCILESVTRLVEWRLVEVIPFDCGTYHCIVLVNLNFLLNFLLNLLKLWASFWLGANTDFISMNLPEWSPLWLILGSIWLKIF